MKKLVLTSLLFVKRVSSLYRLVGFVFGWWLLTHFALPDINYLIAVKKPLKLSIAAIARTDKEQLPRYISLTDAQPLQARISAENLPANISRNMTDLIRAGLTGQGFSYVKEIREKNGQTRMVAVDYPVYSIQNIRQQSNPTAQGLVCHVIIRDPKITETQLENGHFFTDSTFLVEGRFSGDFVDQQTRSLLQNNGYQVSPEAIVLERGVTPLSLQVALTWAVLSVFIMMLAAGSFVPQAWLQSELLPGNQPVPVA